MIINMSVIAIILMCASIGCFIVRYLIKKREINWLTLVVSVCGMCAVLIDPELDTQTMVVAVMPMIFTSLMSALDIMGFGGNKR